MTAFDDVFRGPRRAQDKLAIEAQTRREQTKCRRSADEQENR